MYKNKLASMMIAAVLFSLLTACGSTDSPKASSASTTSFIASYKQGLISVVGMNTSGFTELFDDSFLDAGYTKSQLVENLKQDSINLTSLDADQVFPLLTIEDATVSQCDDSTGICTLTASYVNKAPDSNKTSISVQIRYKDGQFRIYGDQKSA